MSCSVYNVHYTLKPTSNYSGTLDTLKRQLNQVLRLYLGGTVGSVVYKIKDEFRILENGVPDAEDRVRPWLIINVIQELHRLIEEGNEATICLSFRVPVLVVTQKEALVPSMQGSVQKQAHQLEMPHLHEPAVGRQHTA